MCEGEEEDDDYAMIVMIVMMEMWWRHYLPGGDVCEGNVAVGLNCADCVSPTDLKGSVGYIIGGVGGGGAGRVH